MDNAFSGYNQIRMHPSDEDKTTFMAETTNYCYKVMSFGLKNVRATYQHLMDRILQPMIERNVQTYVDDMVVIFAGEECKEIHPHRQTSLQVWLLSPIVNFCGR